MSLDITIGKEIQDKLCEDCRIKLSSAITKTDCLFMTPRGMKRLLNKIDENTCDACRLIIWREIWKNKHT